MGPQFVRACVFCLLCAAHAHCSSHHDINNAHTKTINDHTSYNDGGWGHIAAPDKSDQKPAVDLKNNWMDNQVYVQIVFQHFGDGETISLEGFERLLRAMRLDRLISSHSHSTSNKTSEHTNEENVFRNSSSPKVPESKEFQKPSHCISSESLMRGALVLTPTTYKDVCPVLLSQFLPFKMTNTLCRFGPTHSHSHSPMNKMQDQVKVWLYSSLSIIVISLCGLLGVIVIPIMQKVFYKHFIQFLVALAVGTLCGDALLHLLPHAMTGISENHDVHNEEYSDGHTHGHDDNNLYKGLVAMLGVIFFYFMEKCLTLIAELRTKRLKRTQLMQNVRVMRDVEETNSKTTGEKLCKHKYSSYPYCYGEIADNPEGHMNGPSDAAGGSRNSLQATTVESGSDTRVPVFKKTYSNDHSNGPSLSKESESLDADKRLLQSSSSQNDDERYTVIIREHESSHHGHSHTHGHVHSAPESFSAVAMMVVFGDGLHNFTDGMAIGAAFSANIAGGFSTAVAVFCHELPHELGDFAVLLQAGMSAKQAVFYNLLSSILCFIGMCFGVFLGHSEKTTQWVFAAAAGMFLYIALVDMIPELTNSHSKGGALLQCVLQLAGLFTGVGTMFLIAIYEHDLKNIFGN